MMKCPVDHHFIMAILGFAAFEAANNAQFTYIERFGVFLDVSDQKIGISLLIASLIGIPGAFSIVVIGQRYGTLGPLIFGITIAMAGLAMLLFANSYITYFEISGRPCKRLLIFI